jgi:phage/plasmid-like protein (TIGR03299 family)
MAHLIDNSKGFNAFVSFAAPAWHGLGTILNSAISTQDALTKGGLDYTVLKLPNIHFLPNGEELISEDSFFTVRTDVNKVLGGRLGKDYAVMQNVDALNVVDEILQSGTATIETAGSIDEGRKVFICLKVVKNIVVGSNDTVEQYVLIATSHDGSLSITAMPTNVRVVCNNTLTAALRGSQDKIKIRHTSNATARLSEAAKVLKLMSNNTAANEDNYNAMLDTVISKEDMFNYFGNIFCTPEEIKELQTGKRAAQVLSSRKQNVLAEVLNFANCGQGQDIAKAGNDFTMWGAYNAVTGSVTRKKYDSASSRANSMLFGSAAETIQTAGVLALSPAKIQPLHKVNFSNLNLN